MSVPDIGHLIDGRDTPVSERVQRLLAAADIPGGSAEELVSPSRR